MPAMSCITIVAVFRDMEKSRLRKGDHFLHCLLREDGGDDLKRWKVVNITEC